MRRSSLVISLVVGALLVPVAVFASHQFNDVPDSHIFHTGISWMKDNNITVGCNPPANTNYCPDDNVTRGQMATFMKRLAENNVVDAATLDGLDSTEFAAADALPGVAQTIAGGGVAIPTVIGTLGTVTLESPAAGWAFVSMDADVQISHVNGVTSISEIGVSATADTFEGDEDKDVQLPGGAASGIYISGQSMNKVFPVVAGSNTFYLVGRQTGGTGTLFDVHLTAMFVAGEYGVIQADIAGEVEDTEGQE
jgi:hypothetical protein